MHKKIWKGREKEVKEQDTRDKLGIREESWLRYISIFYIL